MLGLLFSQYTGIATIVAPFICTEAARYFRLFTLSTNAPTTALRIPCTAHQEVTMSSIKIIVLSASLLAAAISSAAAEGFPYSGGPRTGQLNFNSELGRQHTSDFGRSPLNARAQIVGPQRKVVKGGIASRGL
jgi:hypothetical protein